MSLPIYWTPTAKDDFNALLKIIDKKGNVDVILNFLEKIEEVIGSIAGAPREFPTFEHNTRFRIAVINDQTSIIFQVTRANARLLYFWDRRKGVN